jgi:death on curing protein
MFDAMHEAQLREHGGRPGVRDEALVESALARPRNKIAYAAKRDWAVLAAACAFGLARNHGFIDGNKRIAFVAAYVFLGLNGHDLDATESEVVAIMEGRDSEGVCLGEMVSRPRPTALSLTLPLISIGPAAALSFVTQQQDHAA